jgi:alpha-aminoadipate carrier protein LysW
MLKSCPGCDKEINIPDDSAPGEIISCPDCGEAYELDAELNLKPAESVGEDWGQ